jgi:ABC-type antimicrobial peptide transport system permease subunit
MKSLRSLPLRNLAFHGRSHLPVLLGTAIGTAVLVGALLVGDSLRGSLRTKADRQLNGIRTAWIGARFIATSHAGNDTGAILLRGTVECDGRRANQVTVVGLPPSRTLFPGVKLDGRACLSHRLATKLQAAVGSTIRINVEKPTKIPRSSLLGNRTTDDSTLSLRIETGTVLPADDPANDLALVPAPGVPLVVYVPLASLQERLKQSGKINAIFRSDDRRDFAPLTLDDWGLTVRTERVAPYGRKVKSRELPYVGIESDRFVFEDIQFDAIAKAVRNRPGWRIEPTVTYLAIAIAANGKEIPYSIVGSVNPSAASPLGPFLPAGKTTIADDEIALVEWSESPLKAIQRGDGVTVRFFRPEIESDYVETSTTLKFAGFIPFAGPAIDPSLTPQFPGITDKLTVRDWKPPFPYDGTKIKPNDVHEQFWQDYRTTPKAYVSPATARRLFESRYGTVTGLRIAPPADILLESAADELRRDLPMALDAVAGGFVFESIAERLAAAGKGGQDFGGLFLGFSFFLIVASLLLIGLLFRLAMEQRAKSIGLLLAAGCTPARVRTLLVVEGGVVAALGSLLGVGAAIIYSRQLLKLLVSLWPDDSLGSFLALHVTPMSLITGGLAGWLTAVVAMVLAIRKLVRIPPPQLLRGVTKIDATGTASPWRWPPVALFAMAAASVVIGFVVGNPDAKAGSFFGSGGALLAAGVIALRNRWHAPSNRTVRDVPSLARRNARANPGRSLLTVSLVAIASFLLIAVECFRRPTPPDSWQGFTQIAEADVPLYRTFGTGEGFEELITNLEKRYAEMPGDGTPAERADHAKARLDGLLVMPLRSHSGDDASCLNLFQASTPGVVGLPGPLFGKLTSDLGNADTPAVVEQNTLMWMLKSSVGKSITLPDGDGKPVPFRFAATISDSPFQRELLIREDHFKGIYPREDGYRTFLLSMPNGDVSDLLETGFAANGMTVTPIRDRIVGFQAVIGAYLTLFQVLGGLGLLLGLAGLAVVLVRGVWERAGEFALLQALGYPATVIRRLVLVENLTLLGLGLALGIVAALAAVAPHVAVGGSIPGVRLGVLLGSFAVVGTVTTWLATRLALGRPLIAGLRGD